MIDDVTSDDENHFAELYRRLYNSVDDHENLLAIKGNRPPYIYRMHFELIGIVQG